MTEPMSDSHSPLTAADLAELERLEKHDASEESISIYITALIKAAPRLLATVCELTAENDKAQAEISRLKQELADERILRIDAANRATASGGEVARLQALVSDLAGRVAGQSELLASRAEKQT